MNTYLINSTNKNLSNSGKVNKTLGSKVCLHTIKAEDIVVNKTTTHQGLSMVLKLK